MNSDKKHDKPRRFKPKLINNFEDTYIYRTMVPFTIPDTLNLRHVKPQSPGTSNPADTSNLRHIKPQKKNVGLSTTLHIKMPFGVGVGVV